MLSGHFQVKKVSIFMVNDVILCLIFKEVYLNENFANFQLKNFLGNVCIFF